MPHRDSITTEELHEIFMDPAERSRKEDLRRRVFQQAADLRRLKAEGLRLNEIARLRAAKQQTFEFAQPGEDWGSLD